MSRLIGVALMVAALSALTLAGPASAEAGAGTKRLAKAECRDDRRTEPAEFAALYGGAGKAALRRCVRDQKREARADCVGDRREEPAEFATEYGGSGREALKRCMRDELT
jgi:hypothetical protein